MNTPSSSAPKGRDPRDTRQRLVRAALELFTSVGYHASTTPQIARRARVAEGTIYRHFKSKEQMLNDIVRGAVRAFTESLRNSDPTAPCRSRLRQVAESWRRVARRDPALVKLVFVARLDALLDEATRTTYSEFRDELEKILASGKATGEIRTGPVEVWADVWVSLIGMMLERVANGQWAPEHPAPDHIVAAAWDAIAARS